MHKLDRPILRQTIATCVARGENHRLVVARAENQDVAALPVWGVFLVRICDLKDLNSAEPPATIV